MAFSDGSWWLTGGLESRTQEPTLQAIFFDKILVKLVPGKRLSGPQAGHCIAEVAKSFISAGGYTEKVISISSNRILTRKFFCGTVHLKIRLPK